MSKKSSPWAEKNRRKVLISITEVSNEQNFFQKQAEEIFRNINGASEEKVNIWPKKQSDNSRRKRFEMSKIKRVFHSAEVSLVNEKLKSGWYLLALINTNNRIEYALGYIED